MFRSLLQHKGVVAIIGLFAAGALWYGLSQSSTPTPTIVTSNANGATTVPGTSSPIDKDTQNILETLLALRSVKLDDGIFSNSAFTSLKDFSTQIVPEPAGRPDPFAPLSGGTAATAPASLLKNAVLPTVQSKNKGVGR